MASLSGALPNMRMMYSARDDDHILIGADYKQLELWVGLSITGDPVLAEGLKGDLYTEIAKDIFHDAVVPRSVLAGWLGMDVQALLALSIKEQMKLVERAQYDAYLATMGKCTCDGGKCNSLLTHVKYAARHQSKTGYLAARYGIELPGFYRQMLEQDQEMAYSTAGLIHTGLRKRFSRTVDWWYEEMERIRQRGTTSTGMYSESRVLFCRKSYPAAPTLQEAANWPIQTTAAEVHGLAWLKLGSGRKGRSGSLAKFLGEALLVKQWYDAFLIEARREIVDDVIPVVREAMEMPHVIEGREWLFKVDLKTGHRESDV